MDLIVGLLLALLGVLSGFLGGLLGVGGGVIVVPILILAFNLDARVAVGTSLVMIVFTALSGTIAYYGQKRIDWKTGIAAAFVTVPGAALGAYLTGFFASRILALIFGFLLFLVAAAMLRRSFHPRTNRRNYVTISATHDSKSTKTLWRRRIVDVTGMIFEYDANIGPGLAVLFLGGVASGFLGIGGGLIVVPILAAIVGLPMHIAVATSMLTMIFTSISGVSTHIILGNVRIDYAVPLVVGILLGAQFGARTAKKLKSKALERVFALVVLVIAILLILTRI